jgi:uncharacterized protein with PQ loop repeat
MKNVLFGNLSYVIASSFFVCADIPQVIRVYKRKSGRDLSMNSLVLYLLANILQIISGVLLDFYLMFVFGVVYVVLTALKIIMKIMYATRYNKTM